MAADIARKLATYADVLSAPPNMIAQIVNGTLELHPRPASKHTRVASRLGAKLDGPFDDGRDGPGGWILLDEPELHLGANVLVPDLAGWRVERMPILPDAPAFFVRPDWVCEVLSPSTSRLDRGPKLEIYAEHDVPYVWLIDPSARTLEVYRLENKRWMRLAAHGGDDVVRAEPFDAVPLELAALWKNLPPEPER
jgi:Uma2 family endonuclease